MKIRIGLSDNLKKDDLWISIWQQLAVNLGDFPYELVATDSVTEPWLIVDFDSGPFIFSLAEARISLQENLKTFRRSGRLEFYFKSLLINFLFISIKKYVIKRAVFPGELESAMGQAFEKSAAERLAIAYLKRTPVLGAARFIQDTDHSLVIICKDAEIDEKLGVFFTKMHDQGWRFEQIL